MSDKTHNDFKALARNISFRDRSHDLILLKLSNKKPVGSVIILNDSKKNSATVCGHVVENGVAKYLVNKSVKNIFTVSEKQLLES